MLTYPSYRMNEKSPVLDPAMPGIAVSAPPVVEPGRGQAFELHGSFLVAREEVAWFTGNLLQAVVILLRGPQPATLNVGTGELLFPDDLVETGDFIQGFFHLDLFDFFNLVRVPNRYFVSASIFRHLSGVVTVDVAG